jgi:hypothetical protein
MRGSKRWAEILVRNKTRHLYKHFDTCADADAQLAFTAGRAVGLKVQGATSLVLHEAPMDLFFQNSMFLFFMKMTYRSAAA